MFLNLMSSLIVAHGVWEKLPPLPEPAAGFMAASVNGKIIVTGGTNWRDGTKRWLDIVWLFDPAKNEWSAGPALPHPVAYASFAGDGRRLYFAGGADGKAGCREVYALDAGLKLTKIGDLPQPVVFGGASLHDGVLRVFGGTPDPDDWAKVGTQLHGVKVADGSISQLASLKALPHGIGIPAVAATGGRLYAFTGAWLNEKQEVSNLAHAFAYDVAANSWRALEPYPLAARAVFAVTLDEDHLYLAGGYGDDFLSTAYVYHISANRYTPSVPLPLAAGTCLVKCGQHVYLLGGEDQKKHRTDACWRIPVADLLAPLPAVKP